MKFKNNERYWVMGGIYVLALVMLAMVQYDKSLWNVELFKVLLQNVIITALIGTVVSFYFSASKDDTTKAENTGKAFDAITAVAQTSPAVIVPPPATGKPDDPIHTVEDETQ